jgi:hypothetical protein
MNSSDDKSNNQWRIKVNFECDLTYYYQYANVASSGDILKHKYRNFLDMKRISVTYRTFKSGVKP